MEHSDGELAEEYDFFLLKAAKQGFVVEEQVTDDFGADFIPGDTVVEVGDDSCLLIVFRVSTLSTPPNQTTLF